MVFVPPLYFLYHSVWNTFLDQRMRLSFILKKLNDLVRIFH